jgi:hypothetical protein
VVLIECYPICCCTKYALSTYFENLVGVWMGAKKAF